jgi:cytochrome c oxidase subunit 4
MFTPSTAAAQLNHPGAARDAACFAALVLLTVLTFVMSAMNLGAWSLVVSLAIAVTKGSIIALFFMHLRAHEGASRLVLLIAVLFVVILSLLVVADALTRFPAALPAPSVETSMRPLRPVD